MSEVLLYEAMKHCEGLGVQQRAEELAALAGILIASKPKNILEIGVYGGGSFAMWCYLASGKKIAIDSGSIGGPIHDRAKEFNDRFGQVHIIRADSHSAETADMVDKILGDESIDFLFIDGDHTLEGIQLDFALYYPFVSDGGWVAFHDVTESDYHKNMNAGGSAEHWKSFVHPRKVHLNWRDPGFGIGAFQK